MASLRLPVCLWFFIAIAGCSSKKDKEPTPATTPPTESPKVANDAALRPHYQLDGQTTGAGTAFVVADKAGKKYMLTAAHVMDDDAEWQRVKGVTLKIMGGAEAAKVVGRPLYLGKAFDAGDATADLVIWALAEGASAAPLKLAAADPKVNEWVWTVGQEPGSSGPQKMYRCKVTGMDSGGLLLSIHDNFQMRGFSGGPVVNAQGEVVGNVLGGGGNQALIGPVSGIRRRLADAKIELP